MPERREIPFGRPWITDEDRQAVLGVLDGPILTHGPEGKAFQGEFVDFMGGGSALTVSSCMAALHLAYIHLGVGPGDEVLVPAQTHNATAHAVEWVGAKPVFVDCDPATGNVTAEALEAAVTERTRALSVVHYLGIPCDMPSIVDVAERHDLKVVEDCALAIGSRWGDTHVGLFGDVGCYSFYPVKHMTTGEGGMVVSRRSEVTDGIAKLAAFGVDRTHSQRTIPGMYDVPTLGLNYRMSELQAALGRSQLRRMPEALARREANFVRLRDGLSDVRGTTVIDARSDAARSSHYCLSIRLDDLSSEDRTRVVGLLNEAGVGTSTYYPHPVPRLAYYRNKYGYEAGSMPQAEGLSDRAIALPVAPHVEDADIDHIIARFARAVEEVRGA